MVQGTLTDTNIVATLIRDGRTGKPGMGIGTGAGRPGEMMGSSTEIVGNGQPVVAGTISAINGTSLTVTTKSNLTYTVDATNAKVIGGKTDETLSSVVVGDSVLVQGAVNGTSVTASSIVDHSTSAKGKNANAPQGFFGGIGSFFMHLFGF